MFTYLTMIKVYFIKSEINLENNIQFNTKFNTKLHIINSYSSKNLIGI